MHSTPSEIIANQVRKRRRQLDITREQLAEKCVDVGAPQLTLAALTNIETGRPDSQGRRRRDVTVEELIALAAALKIHPVDLMVPGDAPDDEPYPLTAELSTPAAVAREWISGRAFLIAPETPMDFAVAIQAMPKARAEAVSRDWFTQDRQQELNRQALAWEEQQRRPEGPRGSDD